MSTPSSKTPCSLSITYVSAWRTFARVVINRRAKPFERALARFPENGLLYYFVGYAQRAEGQFDAALKSFQRSIELQPDNAAAYANLGFLNAERGQHAEAERQLRRALALDPENYPATYDLGRLLVRLARYDEALPLLERGAKLSQKDPGTHYQLFLAYSRLKRKADADRELVIFKRLEEERKSGASETGGTMANTDELPVPDAGIPASKKP
jgi:tetratricopeptide (TPR) repeat protein